MEPIDTAIKQVGKLANSTSDVVIKYVFMAVLTLFGILFFCQWRQNSTSPDKLITIMEKQVSALTDSLKIQEISLDKIREFSIQVPMEHADMIRKVENNAATLREVREEQSELKSAILANSEAIKANTEAVGKLIKAIEVKIAADPNAPMPPN